MKESIECNDISFIYWCAFAFLWIVFSIDKLCSGEVGGKLPEKILWYELIWVIAVFGFMVFVEIIGNIKQLGQRVKLKT